MLQVVDGQDAEVSTGRVLGNGGEQENVSSEPESDQAVKVLSPGLLLQGF